MTKIQLQQNIDNNLGCLCHCCNPFKTSDSFMIESYKNDHQSGCLFLKIKSEFNKRIKNNMTMKKILILESDVSESLKHEIAMNYDLSLTARASIGLIKPKEQLLNNDFIEEFILLSQHCRQVQNEKGLDYVTEIWSNIFAKKNYLIDYNIKNYNRLDKELAKINIKAKNLANVVDLYLPDYLYYIVVPNLNLL